MKVGNMYRLEEVLQKHLENEEGLRAGYNEFKGSTLAHLSAIDSSITEIKEDTKVVSQQLSNIDRKVTYVYGFAGGLGILAGIIASWISNKLIS